MATDKTDNRDYLLLPSDIKIDSDQSTVNIISPVSLRVSTSEEFWLVL